VKRRGLCVLCCIITCISLLTSCAKKRNSDSAEASDSAVAESKVKVSVSSSEGKEAEASSSEEKEKQTSSPEETKRGETGERTTVASGEKESVADIKT